MRETLVVAGRSARLLAEAASRDGYDVIALDAYGDLDTRRAATRWMPIGADHAARLDAPRTLAALVEAAGVPGVIGWVAGSDFECEPELLTLGAATLPLLGCAPADVRRVRDPKCFFATLTRLGLPHPDTRFEPPSAPAGWLRKLDRGSGGWHIRRADDPQPAPPASRPYFQREAPGRPMSVLFVADGARARCLGFNELIVRPLGAHPHVYRGAIGPVALLAPATAAIDDAVQQLSAEFALRGLCSLDFLHDAEAQQLALLEINPRPSASLALYPALPALRWHVQACREGRLPAAVPPQPLRGHEIVFARHAGTLSAAQAEALAASDDLHDRPAAGSRYAAGDPVCSVDALGNNAAELRERLAGRRQTLRAFLTPAPHPP